MSTKPLRNSQQIADHNFARAVAGLKQGESHSIGWPHYSSTDGACLCMCSRCLGTSGCIDRYCGSRNHVGPAHEARK